MTLPNNKSELIADGAIHVTSIVFTAIASCSILIYAVDNTGPPVVTALAIYCGLMLFSFAVSGVYNLWPFERLREILRRFDHAAIYLKIAGTYTPLAVILGSLLAYIVLGFVWSIAILGAIGKLAIRNWPRGLNTGLTLTLGWTALLLFWPMTQTIPFSSLALILLGGVLYSVGTIFYLSEDMRFHTAIWHGFVLIASASIFAAIFGAIA